MSDLKIEDLITDFEFFDNWEDKYKYIIELGKNCPPLNENEKNNENKVDGCASQVCTKSPTIVLRQALSGPM